MILMLGKEIRGMLAVSRKGKYGKQLLAEFRNTVQPASFSNAQSNRKLLGIARGECHLKTGQPKP